MNIAVKAIIEYLQRSNIIFTYCGNMSDDQGEYEIAGFSPITEYQAHTITWIKSVEKWRDLSEKIEIEKVDFIIIDAETQNFAAFPRAIVCENPKYVFYSILEEFFLSENKEIGIGRNTVMAQDAEIGRDVYIGNGCTIGHGVKIGSGSRIYHNVILHDHVVVGERCCIKSGSVIGEEGYGYSENEGKFYHVPHMGSVYIGDDVEIGANTCIDRGSMDDTIIGSGSKIDNLCHIAHNVKIGERVRIVAGSIIAGSAVIGSGAYVAPGVIVRNQKTVGENSILGMGCVLTENAESGMVYMGVPAKNMRKAGQENL